MTTKQTQRRRLFKTGLGTIVAGLFLAVTGLSMSPASADPGGNKQDDTTKVTICHRTKGPPQDNTRGIVWWCGAVG